MFKMIDKYMRQEEGMAALESAFIFPVLLVLLLGTFDLGQGILAAQKTIRASQVTADLIARHRAVNTGEINEAIEAGRLALIPFADESYGYDILSVEFDQNLDPQILWRQTANMTPEDDVLLTLDNLGSEGEGLIIVQVRYDFEPAFADFVIGTIQMHEIAFVKGRLTPTVPLES